MRRRRLGSFVKDVMVTRRLVWAVAEASRFFRFVHPSCKHELCRIRASLLIGVKGRFGRTISPNRARFRTPDVRIRTAVTFIPTRSFQLFHACAALHYEVHILEQRDVPERAGAHGGACLARGAGGDEQSGGDGKEESTHGERGNDGEQVRVFMIGTAPHFCRSRGGRTAQPRARTERSGQRLRSRLPNQPRAPSCSTHTASPAPRFFAISPCSS